MKKISYGITVCNEITEIAVLIDTLKDKLREGDEIVIQYDEDSVTDVVMEYLNIMKKSVKCHGLIFELCENFILRGLKINFLHPWSRPYAIRKIIKNRN